VEKLLSRRIKLFLNYADELLSSGLYAFKAYWKDSLIYQSDYYRLEAIPDLAPKIEPSSKELYKLHFLKDAKNVQISAKYQMIFGKSGIYCCYFGKRFWRKCKV